MEAVYSRGTIAISLDASQPSFRFYASGAKAARSLPVIPAKPGPSACSAPRPLRSHNSCAPCLVITCISPPCPRRHGNTTALGPFMFPCTGHACCVSRSLIAWRIRGLRPRMLAFSLCAGTYDEPGCMWHADDLDHAVAVVGYGTDEAGADYWIVKNSWSSHWCACSSLE